MSHRLKSLKQEEVPLPRSCLVLSDKRRAPLAPENLAIAELQGRKVKKYLHLGKENVKDEI